ncbi:MAG: lectin like domain-containing protein [Clostridia bacterium]|nr:lectin like domain-containing protein [Clostridia bacterium]
MRIKKLFAVIVSFAIIGATFSTVDTYALKKETAEKSYGRISTNRSFLPKEMSSDIEIAADIPESYDSREKGYVTSVKYQGDYGSCWAHAALSACESSLIINNGYKVDEVDLSESHLCYSAFNTAYDAMGLTNGDQTALTSEYQKYGAIDIGGDIYSSTMALARWQGVVDEKIHPEFSYSKANTTYNFDSENSKAYSLNSAILTDAYWIYIQNSDVIKSMIMKYGAGDFGYFHDDYDTYYNEEYSSYCYIQNYEFDSPRFKYANHEVSLVGWDDNFPKEHFNYASRPKENGAWLCKNSWDSDWGDDGYFWISYEDSSVREEYVGFYALTDISTYDHNYQYDGTINLTSEYESSTEGGYMANVYTSQQDETLKAISLYSYNDNLKYTVDIYKNPTSSPTSGKKLHSLTGNIEYCGYYTIPLNKDIALNEGDKFSVVIHYIGDGSEEISLPCDASSSDEYFIHTNLAQKGQSYYSNNGDNWTDVSEIEEINFRIKAFTVDGLPENIDDTDDYIDSDSETDSDNSEYYIDVENISDDTLRIDQLTSDISDSNVKLIGQVTYIYKDITDDDTYYVILQDMKDSDVISTTLRLNKEKYEELSCGDIVEATGYFRISDGLKVIDNVSSLQVVDKAVIIPATKLILEELYNNYDKYVNNPICLTDVIIEKDLSGKLILRDNDKEISVIGVTDLEEQVAVGSVVSVLCVPAHYDNEKYLIVSDSSCFYVIKEPNSVKLGDANHDDTVNMEDVVFIQKYIAKLISDEGVDKLVSDVNKDTEINMLDVVHLQRYIAKLIDNL